MTHVLLVKGWTARSSWGFPKGKVNKDEAEIQCAQREVYAAPRSHAPRPAPLTALDSYEETSFDITGRASEGECLEAAIHEQRVRLYIIRDVGLDTPFAPRTKKEISKIEWHPVDSLPSSKNSSGHTNANSYFTVIPFVSKLRHWIKLQRSSDKKRLARSAPAVAAAPAPAPAPTPAAPAAPHHVNVLAALRPGPVHAAQSEAARAQAEAAIKALIRYGEEALQPPRSKSITVAELFASAQPPAPAPAPAPVLPLAPAPPSDFGSWRHFAFDRDAVLAALQGHA